MNVCLDCDMAPCACGPTVGALFAGYGGAELALADVFGARPAWFAEVDAAPSRILAHHWPGVPNHGDVTKVKWTPDCPECGRLTSLYWVGEDAHRAYWCREHGEFPLSLRHDEMARTGIEIAAPVDIIAGGSPCQDLSHAGKRAGMKAGTRSGLWASMCDAIETIRPSLVLWENVRGALSASADSAVEPCPICMGDGERVTLRALGRVLGDLAELGYNAAWTGLRAADVGAPHGRFRVFVLAWPAADTDGGGLQGVGRLGSVGHHPDRRGSQGPSARIARVSPGLTLLRTPTAQLAVNGGSQHPDKRKAGGHGPTLADEIEHLLPTPAVNDMGASYTPERWDEWTARMKAAHGNGNGHGASLHIEALRMLPTPSVADVEGGRKSRSGDRSDELLLNGIAATQTFGQYAPAIARWESALGRPAPAPTEPTGKGGAHRLSPAFVEWLMGLPAGHVTAVPGLSRNDQLKALGNGIVPQQAATAIRHLLTIRDQWRAAA